MLANAKKQYYSKLYEKKNIKNCKKTYSIEAKTAGWIWKKITLFFMYSIRFSFTVVANKSL